MVGPDACQGVACTMPPVAKVPTIGWVGRSAIGPKVRLRCYSGASVARPRTPRCPLRLPQSGGPVHELPPPSEQRAVRCLVGEQGEHRGSDYHDAAHELRDIDCRVVLLDRDDDERSKGCNQPVPNSIRVYEDHGLSPSKDQDDDQNDEHEADELAHALLTVGRPLVMPRWTSMLKSAGAGGAGAVIVASPSSRNSGTPA